MGAVHCFKYTYFQIPLFNMESHIAFSFIRLYHFTALKVNLPVKSIRIIFLDFATCCRYHGAYHANNNNNIDLCIVETLLNVIRFWYL